MHWSFEKYWFTRLCRSFKCWYILLYNILKITFPVYSRFQKFQLVLQNSDFITWQQMLPVVFLEATGPRLSFFLRKYLPNIQVWIVTVEWFSWKKRLVQFEAATIAEVLYSCFPFSHAEYKMLYTQASRFKTNFYCFKNILKWTCVFKGQVLVTTDRVWGCCLDAC